MFRILAFLCVASVPVFAKAPALPGYRCPDELLEECRVRIEVIEARRAHRAKPRIERMIVSVGDGAKRFEGSVVNGSLLVRELLGSWKPGQTEKIGAEEKRILSLLPDSLRRRYAGSREDRALASEKRRAARRLTIALAHALPHIRRAAIATLKVLFGTDLGFPVDLPVADRRRLQAAWKREIAKR